MPALGEFLLSRWRGQAPLRRLFWRDMLGLATLVNVLASFVALMMMAQGASGSAAVAMHFAPTPWNAFLVACVLRHPQVRGPQRIGAVAWLALTLVI